MDSMSVVDILIFGMIALFVGLRLYSVLGTKTGREPKPGPDPFSPEARQQDRARPELAPPRPERPMDNITPFPGRTSPTGLLSGQSILNPGQNAEPANGPGSQLGTQLSAQVIDGVRSVRRIDGRFDPDQFIAGAGHAYETIVGAFAVGDKTALKSLLDPSVYESFASAIDQRVQAGHVQESQFTKIKGADLREISLRGSVCEITVRFASDMIIATRDASGAVIAGSPTTPREVIDLWTFARDLRSKDPNWLLIATGGTV
jgi:predicted lipid-binding transport protein (Tim44 family)